MIKLCPFQTHRKLSDEQKAVFISPCATRVECESHYNLSLRASAGPTGPHLHWDLQAGPGNRNLWSVITRWQHLEAEDPAPFLPEALLLQRQHRLWHAVPGSHVEREEQGGWRERHFQHKMSSPCSGVSSWGNRNQHQFTLICSQGFCFIHQKTADGNHLLLHVW